MLVLEVKVKTQGDGAIILSPAVGIFYNAPPNGTFLSKQMSVGCLNVLNTHYDLQLPKGISGITVMMEGIDHIIPVGYGQILFSLRQGINQDIQVPKNGDMKETSNTCNDEGHVITAFTTGIFYQRSSPDSSPYVQVGEEIKKGQILGLIEVMKTFNQIIFQGIDNADTGTVKKIYAEDSQEVNLGEKLFLIE